MIASIEHQVRGEFLYLTAHLVGSGELVALVDEAFWLVGFGVGHEDASSGSVDVNRNSF